MKKRKVFLLLVCLLAIVLVFFGCSNEKNSEAGDPGIAKEDISGNTKSTEISGVVTVWIWEQGKNALEPLLDKFYQQYPKVEIKFELLTNNDMYKKMLLALSSGEGLPDIATYETSNLAQVVSLGALFDLTEKVEPYKDKINTFKWADASMEGRIYAMPWDSGPVGLYYNRTVFEEAGFDSDPESVAELLKTWKEYKRVAKIIKDKTGSFMFAESKEKSFGRIFQMMLWQQNSWYVDKENNLNMASSEAVNALSYLKNMIDEGLVDNSEEWTQSWYDGFKEGRVATIPAACWMGGFLSGWIAPESHGEWGVVPLPAWNEGGVRTANDGGSNLVIPKLAKNPEAAWAFIEFCLANEESQLEIFKSQDIFPALETTYDSDFFNEEIAYFKGQKVRTVFSELVKEVPNIAYTRNYAIFNGALMTATQKVYLKNMSVKQALEEAEEEVSIKMEY